MHSRHRLWPAVAGLAALTLALPISASASAATLIGTQMVLTVTPTAVSYPAPQITVTGTLETAVAGQTPQPLPGEPVTLQLRYENGQATQDLGTFTTDGSGTFTTTITATVPGSVLATFAGNSTYRSREILAGWHAATSLPTQITVDPIAPAPYGSTVPVTVHVTMQSDGTWVPAPYAPIEPLGCNAGSQASYFTDASGTATEELVAEPTPDCVFYSDGNADDSWTSQDLSSRVVVPLSTFPAQITDFGPGVLVQDNRVAINALNFLGIAQYTDAAGVAQGYPDATVQLYFQPGGSSAWQLEATTTAGADGLFQFPTVAGYLADGRLATGLWEAVIPAAGSYLAASTVNDAVVLSVPVYIRNAKIRRVGHVRYLTGTLDYLPRGGPLHGVKVDLLLQRQNGKTRTERTVTTASNGYFSLRLTMPAPGGQYTYAAYYPGGPLPDWIGPDTSAYAVGQPVYSWATLRNP